MPNPKQPYIGGQAVIEGVMMKAPTGISVAVRRPDGSIVVQEEPYVSRLGKGLWKLPGFRGVATLVESLKIGYAALNWSAEQQMTEDEKAQQSGGGKLAMVLSVVLALGLFVALPQALASGSGKLFGIDFGLSDANFHLVIGGFKLLIVTAYMIGISRIKEVRRVFQYHGAEHKTINAWERDLPMTVENVRSQTTMHPRCGTTFLIVVVIVSILVGSAVAPLVMPEGAEGFLAQIALLGLRIALLPVIAAISFELQRLSARYCMTGPLRVFLLPGFLFQKITTREPDDDQIEVAITAMEAAAWRERVGDTHETSDDPLVFPHFEGFREALPSLRPAART